MLSQERLKELLHYSPETGVFSRRVALSNRSQVGEYAGHYGTRVSIVVGGKRYRAHRLAFLYMTGAWPEKGVDHIDGNPLNNAWCNLREADQRTNMRNARAPVTNTSGVVGVRLFRGWWCARIMVDKKELRLGKYSSFLDAVAARKSAELKHNFHPNHGRK